MSKEENAAKEISTPSGLASKSITGLTVYRNGSVGIVEVKHAAGTVFLKTFCGRFEYGGDVNWGTGTEVALP